MTPPNPPNPLDFAKRFPAFGALLHNYRTLRGMTVERLAEAVGISPQAIREMEQGRRPPPAKDIVTAIAGALHIGKDERSIFVAAAELGSPAFQALQGQALPPPDHPSLAAAILVFLIADIRGYTHFTVERGDEAAARLTQRFAELAHAAIEECDGHLIEVRGDEILAVFASVRQALRAAHALQARCVEETGAHPDVPLDVGIGLDVGEAVPVDGGGYRGAALNRAARLCALAGAGEVLASAGVVYLAPQVEGMTFVARGQAPLKGFDGPTPIWRATPTPLVSAADDSVADADAREGKDGLTP